MTKGESEAKGYTGPHWNRRDLCYQIKFQLHGVRKTKSAPREITKPETARAEAWAQDYVAELRKKDRAPPATKLPPQTLRQLGPTWLKLRATDPKIGPRMRVQDEGNLRLHVYSQPIADVPIAELEGHLRTWLRDLTSRLAGYTVRNAYNTLGALFRDLSDERVIQLPANPMHDRRLRRLLPEAQSRAGAEVTVHLEAQHLAAYLSADHEVIERWRRVKDVLAFTSGLRDGELHGLAWSHLVLTSRSDEIPHVEVSRQAAMRGGVTFSPPKKKSYRRIPLHDLAIQALTWWRDVGFALRTGRPPRDADAVFPGTSGEAWRPRSAMLFKVDLAVAGVPTHYAGFPLDYHATRRSFATYLEGAGVPRYIIGELLGHAAEGTARRHYIAANMAPWLEAIRKLDLSAVRLRWVGKSTHSAPNPLS